MAEADAVLNAIRRAAVGDPAHAGSVRLVLNGHEPPDGLQCATWRQPTDGVKQNAPGWGVAVLARPAP